MVQKKALVTGASEGLGRTFARQLADRGYQVTGVARNEVRLRELMAELSGGAHDYIVADLGTDAGQDLCVERLRGGRYQLLVNNAGYSRFGHFEEADIAQEQKILAVNCQALMVLAHVFLQSAVPGDALINLSSITHYLTTPIQPTYCASKSFIASFSASLWYQQRKRGVYVQGLCPGITRTEFIDRAGVDRAGFEEKKHLLDWISGTPDNVIAASLLAMEKRKGPIVIPGLDNKLIALFTRMLPTKVLVYLLGRVGDLA